MATFVLVHGLAGQPDQWRWLIEELEGRGHDALALRLPGGTWEEHLSFLDQHAPGNVLVGHSLGGLIVRCYAETRPDRAAGIGLIAPAPPSAGYGWVREVGGVDPDGVYRIRDLDRFLALAFPGAPDDLRGWTWEQRLPTGAPPLPGTLGSEPAIVIAAEDDAAVPLEDQRSQAEALNCPVAQVPGGHSPHVRHPALVATLLVNNLVGG